jgi:myo-inositol 2-dehydrogenase/D-chiro-inositol 1-dehydrogenase
MRLGVIGTGEMAVKHVLAWQRLGADILVHSRSAGRRDAFAREHGVTAVADRDELYAQAELIDICTPTDTHASLVLQAAATGRDVVCEKPLARTFDDAKQMIDTCRSAGVRLFVGHTLRYFPAYEHARELVVAGRIGRVRSVKLLRNGEYPHWGEWFGDPARSGGVIVDLGIHDIDYARWVAGDVIRVSASEEKAEGGLPITGTVHLTHANGAESEIVARWDHVGAEFHTTLEIVGEEGELRFDSLPNPVLTDGAGTKLYVDDFSVEPYTAQLGEFVSVLRVGGQPRVTPEDGLAALAIALDAERSASGHA